jgi:transposase
MVAGFLIRRFVMQAYSEDLRLRVLADSRDGLSTEAVAQKLRVSGSWVRKVKQRHRQTGETAPRKARVSHATKLDAHLEQLDRCVTEQPDATLNELRDRMPVTVGASTVWRALKRLRLSFKKSPSCFRAAAPRCAAASR